jgi:hypothetical protein
MVRKKSKYGEITISVALLFSVFLLASIIALLMILNFLEGIRMEEVGLINSIKVIHIAVSEVCANPGSGIQIKVYVAEGERISFSGNTVSVATDVKIDESLLYQELKNLNATGKVLFKVEKSDSGFEIQYYYRDWDGNWQVVEFSQQDLVKGTYLLTIRSKGIGQILISKFYSG